MTGDKIFEESMKPSTNWIETGSGELGKLYVEVLGCSDLPKPSANLLDATDAFACLVMEDAVVNTDVIGNCQNPRWMPWCQRAFVFNVCHPSSSLYLGLFNHDREIKPFQDVPLYAASVHSPLGRVEINVSNFNLDTVYTLSVRLLQLRLVIASVRTIGLYHFHSPSA